MITAAMDVWRPQDAASPGELGPWEPGLWDGRHGPCQHCSESCDAGPSAEGSRSLKAVAQP